MQTEIRYATPNIRVAQLLIDTAEENGMTYVQFIKILLKINLSIGML